MGKVVLAGIFTLAAATSLAQTGALEQAGSGGPANLCQELVAFVREPPPAAAAPGAAAPAAAKPGQEGGKAPASGEAVAPRPPEATQSAQEASGQTGPAHEAPQPNAAAAESGKAPNPELRSGLSAPVPTDTTSPATSGVLSLAEAEELASANDIAACQRAARELRLAGAAMPPPLLALTALDLQYHRTGESRSQVPGAADPALQQTGTD